MFRTCNVNERFVRMLVGDFFGMDLEMLYDNIGFVNDGVCVKILDKNNVVVLSLLFSFVVNFLFNFVFASRERRVR